MRVKDGLKRRHYFKEAGKYFVENGIGLVLVNLIPCMLLPFAFSPSGMLYMLFSATGGDEPTLKQVLTGMFDTSYSFWYIGLIGLLLLTFSVAISFGAVDRHMRVGELTFGLRSVKSRLNYNLTTAIKFVLTLAVCLELFEFLISLLYYMWMAIFDGKVVRIVFCAISCALTEVPALLLLSMMLLWTPYMLHVGMRSSDAFKASWRAAASRVWSIALCLLSVTLPFQCLSILVAALDLGPIVRTIVDGLSYAFFIPYYIALTYTVFYDVTGTERMDRQQNVKDIWKK